MKKILHTLLLLPAIALAQVANDEYDTAEVVPINPEQICNSSIEGTLSESTLSTGFTDCSVFTAYNDVWYEFTATTDKIKITLNTMTPEAVIYFSLYDDSAETTLLQCSEGLNYMFVTGLTLNSDYKIRVFSSFNNEASLNANFSLCLLTSPNAITTSATDYTPEDIITNMLTDNDNVTIVPNSITYSSGSAYGFNSIGSFEQNGSDFPFESGLILSTGAIENAPGPKTSIQSAGNLDWTGDNDLENYLATDGIITTLQNATSLEFDFVALTQEIHIKFLYTSDEYGPNQCFATDYMAFLVTDLDTPDEPIFNFAFIPGTFIDINTSTIHDATFNGECESVNEGYFDNFNQFGDFSSTNFNGSTIPMDVYTAVTPGHTYHLKIVIADREDTSFDSAIFINGSGFLGGWEGPELITNAPTGESDQFFYAGETLADLEVEGENIQWYETETGDTPIPMTTPLQDGATYYATQSIDGIESNERFAVTAHQILGVEDNIFKNLTYYPNPVSNILTLSNANEISKVEAYNLLGQKVLAKNFSATEAQVDMSSLETGIYLVKITSKEELTTTIRIQKQ